MLYNVTVFEQVTVKYLPVEIEAKSADEARDIAEEMRQQGELGNPRDHESVDYVDFEVKNVCPIL